MKTFIGARPSPGKGEILVFLGLGTVSVFWSGASQDTTVTPIFLTGNAQRNVAITDSVQRNVAVTNNVQRNIDVTGGARVGG